MRVATWRAVESVALEDVSDPEPGARDVLIDVLACGICGSDVHSYVEGAWIAAGVPMGHEYAGRVAAVGPQVSGVQVGDLVAVNPASPCGHCPRCTAGRTNLCSQLSGHGGGFADQVVVRDAVVGETVFPLPPDFDPEAAAFLEPLSVAVRAVDQADPPLDEPTLVIGLGTIGQCVVRVLLARGARDVIALDTSKLRRDAAALPGVDVMDPMATDVRSALLDSRGRTSSPYQPESGAIGSVFECSGAPAAHRLAVEVAHATAPVSLIALSAGPVPIDINSVVQKELRLLGSFAYTARDCSEAHRLLVGGEVDVAPLVTHRFALADIGGAFEAQRDTAASIKVMVRP